MWLKRLVGVVVSVSLVAMSLLVVLGFIIPDTQRSHSTTGTDGRSTVVTMPAPSVALTAKPTSIQEGDSSSLVWSTTGSPTSCRASGSWNGDKAASGTESTGRLAAAGNHTFTLTCLNASGSGKASVVVNVSKDVVNSRMGKQ